MRFTIQRALMSRILGMLSPFLAKKGEKIKDSGDQRGHVRISVKRDALLAAVLRPQVSVEVRIDSRSAAREDVLQIASPGSFVGGGNLLVRMPCIGDEREMLPFEKLRDGNLSMTFSGAKGRRDQTDFFPLEDPPRARNIECDQGQCLVLPAKNLARYGRMIGTAASSVLPWVRLRAKKGECQLATCNGMQAAIAKVPELDGSEGEHVMAHNAFLRVANRLDPEGEVKVMPSRDGKWVVFKQSIRIGGRNVGEFTAALQAGGDFRKFDDKIAALEMKFSCKARKGDLASICRRLDMSGTARTKLLLDAKAGLLVFGNMDGEPWAMPSRLKNTIEVEVTSKNGDSLELDVSSRHLSGAVAAVANEQGIQDMELSFSGEKSLALISMGPDVRMYFAPYRDAPPWSRRAANGSKVSAAARPPARR